MNQGFSMLAVQLAHLLPGLCVYSVAFILGVTHLRRAFAPSVLSIIGAMLLGLGAIGGTVVQSYLINNGRMEMIAFISPLVSLVHSGGIAVLVAAIFIGRHPTV